GHRPSRLSLVSMHHLIRVVCRTLRCRPAAASSCRMESSRERCHLNNDCLLLMLITSRYNINSQTRFHLKWPMLATKERTPSLVAVLLPTLTRLQLRGSSPVVTPTSSSPSSASLVGPRVSTTSVTALTTGTTLCKPRLRNVSPRDGL